MTDRSGEQSPMNSSEPVGDPLMKVASVSPNVISQKKKVAERADEDTHEDNLMPVEPDVVAEDQVEG